MIHVDGTLSRSLRWASFDVEVIMITSPGGVTHRNRYTVVVILNLLLFQDKTNFEVYNYYTILCFDN